MELRNIQEPVIIALAANNEYVPYLAATVQSVAQSAQPFRPYEIYVLTGDITLRNRELLKQQMRSFPQVMLEFVDVSPWQERVKDLFVDQHFSVESYYRLLLPELLPQAPKVLYLDCDLVACTDLAPLFDTSLGQHFLAGTLDVGALALLNDPESDWRSYLEETLKLASPQHYLQAGVLVMNLERFRAELPTDELLAFAAQNKLRFLDQDVLNALTAGNNLVVPMDWDVLMDSCGTRVAHVKQFASPEVRDQYLQARLAPKVVHYAGPDKPWNTVGVDLAECFWAYARRTPFYEEAASQSMTQRLNKLESAAWQAVEGIWARIGDIEVRITNLETENAQLKREIVRLEEELELKRQRTIKDFLFKKEKAVSGDSGKLEQSQE